MCARDVERAEKEESQSQTHLPPRLVFSFLLKLSLVFFFDFKKKVRPFKKSFVLSSSNVKGNEREIK